MCSHIMQNGSGCPPVCRQVVVHLIGSMTTKEGLRTQSGLDANACETGRTVTDEEMEHLAPDRAAFHREWTYKWAARQ